MRAFKAFESLKEPDFRSYFGSKLCDSAGLSKVQPPHQTEGSQNQQKSQSSFTVQSPGKLADNMLWPKVDDSCIT